MQKVCMAYVEKGHSSEVVLVEYYNILFYLIFRVVLDEFKKNILVNRIDSGERMMMKDILRMVSDITDTIKIYL